MITFEISLSYLFHFLYNEVCYDRGQVVVGGGRLGSSSPIRPFVQKGTGGVLFMADNQPNG